MRAVEQVLRIRQRGAFHPPPDLARQEYIPGGLDLDVDGISAMEPFWEFPILVARPW